MVADDDFDPEAGFAKGEWGEEDEGIEVHTLTIHNHCHHTLHTCTLLLLLLLFID